MVYSNSINFNILGSSICILHGDVIVQSNSDELLVTFDGFLELQTSSTSIVFEVNSLISDLNDGVIRSAEFNFIDSYPLTKLKWFLVEIMLLCWLILLGFVQSC